MVIVLRAEEHHVQHVVVEVVVLVVTHHIPLRHTPRMVLVLVALVAVVVHQVPEEQNGRKQVLLFYIRLQPIRETVESRAASQPDLRDVFLCHAWGDRKEAAKELNDLLVAAGVKVWFSENDLALGVPMMRAIDKGLAKSRIGLVLVTPAMLERLPKESVADKELSALLAGNQLIPIMHNATYDELRNVSPLLASRSGLDTAEDSMAVVAEKIAELVSVEL